MVSLSTGDGDLIYNLALECEDLFCPNESHAENLSAVRSEMLIDYRQRFAAWAAYMGVFARKSQSLDQRLQGSPDHRDLIVRLLDILRDLLHRFWAPSSVAHGHSLDSQIGNVTDGASEVNRENLQEIDGILGRLSRLGVAIRQSSRANLSARVELFGGALDVATFEGLATPSIHTLYPKAHQGLRERLIKSMINCYANITYLQSRQATLQSRRRAIASSLPTVRESDKQNDDQIPVRRGEVEDTARAQRPTQHVSGGLPSSSQWGLSSLNTTVLRKELEIGPRAPKTSSVYVSQAQYPHPRRESSESTVICEWCSQPLIEEALEESAWRSHIHKDLKPYICLWHDRNSQCCAFGTFEEWCRHMSEHSPQWHRDVFQQPSWICPICAGGAEVFQTSQDLFVHMEETHTARFTLDQLRIISRQSRIETRSRHDECPLCCFRVQEDPSKAHLIPIKREKGISTSRPNKSARHIGIPHRSGGRILDGGYSSDDSTRSTDPVIQKSPKVVARHVASHLQSIMLLTIRFVHLIRDREKGQEALSESHLSDAVDVDSTGSASKVWGNTGASAVGSTGSAYDHDKLSDFRSGLSEDVEASNADFYVDWDDVPLVPQPPLEEDKFLQGMIRSWAHEDDEFIMITLPLDHQEGSDEDLSSLVISGANVERDHHKLQRIRFPGSGRWLFGKEQFRRWFEPRSDYAMLWISGPSGAGKSVLASLVIDELRTNASGYEPAPRVLFCYCNCLDSDRDSFEAIGRSLIVQLLTLDDASAAIVRSICLKTEGPQDKRALLQLLLSATLPKHPSTWIVLDGVDQCRDMTDIVAWFQNLVYSLPVANFGTLRILFTSTDETLNLESFSSIPSVTIEQEDTQSDVVLFGEAMATRIQEKFKLPDELRVSIAATLRKAGGGTFVATQRICNNLLSQPSRQCLEEELLPQTSS